MFPLEFPLGVLSRVERANRVVLDPFSGRGTTALASRLRGLPSFSIDSNPVAHALSAAKLVYATPEEILRAFQELLQEVKVPMEVPEGPFWRRAFHPEVLMTLCRAREALLRSPTSASTIALRATLLGALHGPRTKGAPSYFSNQSPRTFAPKPAYAVRYWRHHKLRPVLVEMSDVVARRARRYYSERLQSVAGAAICADSRDGRAFEQVGELGRVGWVITSPPYYGMRTYLPDQWLRLWFLGGKSTVTYEQPGQLSHSSPAQFAEELRTVWRNARKVASDSARLVIRFGGINDRSVEPRQIVSESLSDSGWRVQTIKSAGLSSRGKRQALHFIEHARPPREEYDLWAVAC